MYWATGGDWLGSDPEALGNRVKRSGEAKQAQELPGPQGEHRKKISKCLGDRRAQRPQSLPSQVLCSMCVQVHLEARGQPRCHPSSIVHLFLNGISHCAGAHQIGPTGWPTSFRNPPVSGFPALGLETYTTKPAVINIYSLAQGLNLGPHGRKAGACLLSHLPSPKPVFFDRNRIKSVGCFHLLRTTDI